MSELPGARTGFPLRRGVWMSQGEHDALAAALEATAAERDRAHATLREIRDEHRAFPALWMRRLARERLENP